MKLHETFPSKATVLAHSLGQCQQYHRTHPTRVFCFLVADARHWSPPSAPESLARVEETPRRPIQRPDRARRDRGGTRSLKTRGRSSSPTWSGPNATRLGLPGRTAETWPGVVPTGSGLIGIYSSPIWVSRFSVVTQLLW